MSHDPKLSRILLGPQTFLGNQTLAIENPANRGFGSKDQLAAMIICLDGTATTAAATGIRFNNMVQVFDFLDSHIAQIRLNSTALSDLVMQQPLSNLVRAAAATWGIWVDGLPAIGRYNQLNAANTFTYRVRIRIPWDMEQYSHVGAAHAPFFGFMLDNGLSIITGDGTFAAADQAGAVQNWVVQATTLTTVRLEYETGRPVAKVSPFVYGHQNVNQNEGNVLPAGAYYGLCQSTTNTTGIASNAPGSGHRLWVDGKMVQAFEEEDPTTRYSDVSRGWADAGAKLARFVEQGGDTAAAAPLATFESPTPLDAPWAPIIGAAVRSDASSRLEPEERLIVDAGATYPAATTYDYVMVRPISGIGEGKDACACNGRTLTTIPLRNSRRIATSKGNPKGLSISPQLIG